LRRLFSSAAAIGLLARSPSPDPPQSRQAPRGLRRWRPGAASGRLRAFRFRSASFSPALNALAF